MGSEMCIRDSLLTEERDVKLADFSIAMIARPDVVETQFTGFLGSPLYMSPEQISEQWLSGSSDIFSLGAVMYQLLTGIHPFKAGSLAAIQYKLLNEEPAPLEDYRADLPDGLAYTLRRMLKKRPNDRYATGLDLAADLAVIFEDLDNVDTEDAPVSYTHLTLPTIYPV